MVTTSAAAAIAGDPVDLATQVVEILRETHGDYSDSQRVSRSDDHLVYGAIWKDLPKRLCAGLGKRRTDVDIRKIYQGSYHVPVIAGTIYFPWRPPGGARPEDAAFAKSEAREGLWRQHWEQDALPLGDGLSDGENLVLDRRTDTDVTVPMADVLAASDGEVRVVMIAMTSTATQLDRIEWGEANLAADGKLIWDPKLLWSGADTPVPTSPAMHSFDSGTAPKPTISPRVQPEGHRGGSGLR